jgi:hypothetical protein
MVVCPQGGRHEIGKGKEGIRKQRRRNRAFCGMEMKKEDGLWGSD